MAKAVAMIGKEAAATDRFWTQTLNPYLSEIVFLHLKIACSLEKAKASKARLEARAVDRRVPKDAAARV